MISVSTWILCCMIQDAPRYVICFWAENAQGRFNIIAEGRFHYQIILNTTLPMQQDTTLHGINYKLMSLTLNQTQKCQ